MTTTQESAVAVELITVVIDGFEVSVPKGTLIIRAAEKLEFRFHVSAITRCSIQLVLVANV